MLVAYVMMCSVMMYSVVIFCARDAFLKTSIIHNLHNSRHVLKHICASCVFFIIIIDLHYFKLCT
jgi:hypothetical protein